MLEKNQSQIGFMPLEELQLLQEFQVEELEKRYEFSWGELTASASNNTQTGTTVSVSYSVKF